MTEEQLELLYAQLSGLRETGVSGDELYQAIGQSEVVSGMSEEQRDTLLRDVGAAQSSSSAAQDVEVGSFGTGSEIGPYVPEPGDLLDRGSRRDIEGEGDLGRTALATELEQLKAQSGGILRRDPDTGVMARVPDEEAARWMERPHVPEPGDLMDRGRGPESGGIEQAEDLLGEVGGDVSDASPPELRGRVEGSISSDDAARRYLEESNLDGYTHVIRGTRAATIYDPDGLVAGVLNRNYDGSAHVRPPTEQERSRFRRSWLEPDAEPGLTPQSARGAQPDNAAGQSGKLILLTDGRFVTGDEYRGLRQSGDLWGLEWRYRDMPTVHGRGSESWNAVESDYQTALATLDNQASSYEEREQALSTLSNVADELRDTDTLVYRAIDPERYPGRQQQLDAFEHVDKVVETARTSIEHNAQLAERIGLPRTATYAEILAAVSDDDGRYATPGKPAQSPTLPQTGSVQEEPFSKEVTDLVSARDQLNDAHAREEGEWKSLYHSWVQAGRPDDILEELDARSLVLHRRRGEVRAEGREITKKIFELTRPDRAAATGYAVPQTGSVQEEPVSKEVERRMERTPVVERRMERPHVPEPGDLLDRGSRRDIEGEVDLGRTALATELDRLKAEGGGVWRRDPDSGDMAQVPDEEVERWMERPYVPERGDLIGRGRGPESGGIEQAEDLLGEYAKAAGEERGGLDPFDAGPYVPERGDLIGRGRGRDIEEVGPYAQSTGPTAGMG